MICTVCGSRLVARAFEHAGYQLLRCRDCSHQWIDNTVDAVANYDADYYRAAAQSGDDSGGYADYLASLDRRVQGFRKRVDQIEAVTGRRGKLLDYGCAVGACVKAAREAGWDAIGYERSRWAADYGRSMLGVEIVTGDALDPQDFAPGSFDVVTLWDVIEHVDRPRELLAFVARVLRPGGVVALNTVNASSVGARIAGRRWRHLSPPYHLQYFTRASLRRLVAGAGFEITRTAVNGVMLGSAKGPTRLPQPLRIIEDVVTHWRMRPVARALNLLDEIEIMAVRPRN